MNHTNEETKPPTAETIQALKAQLKAATAAHNAEERRKSAEVQRKTEEEQRAREAALPQPPPLPPDVEQLAQIYRSTIEYLKASPGLLDHNRAAQGVASHMSDALYVFEGARRLYHRAELERAARENEPEIYTLSSVMRSPDDVMVVGSGAFRFSGHPWEREGERPRVVRMPGPFGFVSRDEWNAGLRELHAGSRAEKLRRLRADLEFMYRNNPDVVDSMAEKLAPQWAREVDREVGFTLEAGDRWDLPTIARRSFGYDERFPLGSQVDETAKRCACPITRVHWASTAAQRGGAIGWLESWMREERGRSRVGSDRSAVDDAVAFWAAHDAAERSTT